MGSDLDPGGKFLQALTICVIFLLSTDELDVTWVTWKHVLFPPDQGGGSLFSPVSGNGGFAVHATTFQSNLLGLVAEACKCNRVHLMQCFFYVARKGRSISLSAMGFGFKIFQPGFRNSGRDFLGGFGLLNLCH